MKPNLKPDLEFLQLQLLNHRASLSHMDTKRAISDLHHQKQRARLISVIEQLESEVTTALVKAEEVKENGK